MRYWALGGLAVILVTVAAWLIFWSMGAPVEPGQTPVTPPMAHAHGDHARHAASPPEAPPGAAPAAAPALHDHAAQAGPFWENLFKVYTPRQVCMFYEQPVIWLHMLSDLFIGIAYFSIPVALVYFARKRRDVAFHWMFWMFAAFIFSCGATHFIGVWALWQPLYKVDGLVKAGTALISVATAIALWPLIPKALALPSPAMLEQRVRERTAELAEANEALTFEIKARRQAEEERERLLDSERAARTVAEEASRVKDEFLATLSHELRTPLNAIMGWAQILNRGTRSADDAKRGLEAIERNARVQAQLVADLLDMSRIVSGKVKLEVRRVDPTEIIDAAIDTVRHAADAKGIRLVKVLDTHAGAVRGDAGRLQQVIWNLLSNAIKFTPKGGRVSVTLARVNSHIEITVSDTGQGIAPEFLPHVFERFRQADSSATREHGGLGLGLSLVKHFVELHGGAVRAESEGPDAGSTFIVDLPLASVSRLPETQSPGEDVQLDIQPLTPSPRTQPPALEPVSLQGLRVLAVDDQADARALLARVFDGTGAEVVTAATGEEGLELLRGGTYHVLISDVGMPAMDGYAFIRRVRELPPEAGGRIPAIALTAFARPEDRRHALLAGYQVHVAKPVDAAELLAVVAGLARIATEDSAG